MTLHRIRHDFQSFNNSVYTFVYTNIKITPNTSALDPARGDPDLLKQAIENLLKNSLEAQQNGGFVDIKLGELNGEIFIKFSNGGFCLPPEQADKIMDPYFTTKSDGTGLGLSITRKIIQAHNGRIEIKCPGINILEITVYLPKQ